MLLLPVAPWLSPAAVPRTVGHPGHESWGIALFTTTGRFKPHTSAGALSAPEGEQASKIEDENGMNFNQWIKVIQWKNFLWWFLGRYEIWLLLREYDFHPMPKHVMSDVGVNSAEALYRSRSSRITAFRCFGRPKATSPSYQRIREDINSQTSATPTASFEHHWANYWGHCPSGLTSEVS